MQLSVFDELSENLGIGLSAAIAGDKTPKQALDDAQAEWVKIMKTI